MGVMRSSGLCGVKAGDARRYRHLVGEALSIITSSQECRAGVLCPEFAQRRNGSATRLRNLDCLEVGPNIGKTGVSGNAALEDTVSVPKSEHHPPRAAFPTCGPKSLRTMRSSRNTATPETPIYRAVGKQRPPKLRIIRNSA